MINKIKLTTILIILTIGLAYAQEFGKASYYSHKLKGRHTSNGGKYHPDSLTCAHRTYAFGTILKVRNPKNNKEVLVKVTDRGPRQKRLLIDLSYSAAKHLEIIQQGIAKIEITKLDLYPTQPDIIPFDSIYSNKTDSIHSKI